MEIGKPLLLALILCHECEQLGWVRGWGKKGGGKRGRGEGRREKGREPDWTHVLGDSA